jgi:hypothetical protein
MRRYIIRVDQSVTWTLVHDEAVGRWHVKKHETQVKAQGNQKALAKLTFDVFEQGDEAEPLTARFAEAVKAAQQDV